VYTIAAVSSLPRLAAAPLPHEAEPLRVHGPRFALRYATLADAAALFELGRDPAVTRFFSWGPYTSIEQPEAYIAAQRARRERGEQLDLLIVDAGDRPVGVTGLAELARRDRRATVGSWLGHRWWGSGANREAKALIAALAFRELGLERLTALAATRNGRSQAALERLGFRREGVLAAYHRHADGPHDVVVYGLVRAAWERSVLHAVPARIEGCAPPAFVVS
jgi:[ribosomal protein S5]-alanine N-acetyltransferase